MIPNKLKKMLIDLETLDDLEGLKQDILSGLEMIMEGLQDVHDAIYMFDLPEFDDDGGRDIPPKPGEKTPSIFPDKEEPYDLPF